MSHYTHEATVNNNSHLGATSGRESHNTHLGASTARDGDTLSAGSTANGIMADHNNGLEKDFSRQNGKELPSLRHGLEIDGIQVMIIINIWITTQTQTLLYGTLERLAASPSPPSFSRNFTCLPKTMSRVNSERPLVTLRHCK
jgi:hypothetical protein